MKTLLKISTLVATVVAASALASTSFAGQMNQDQNNFVNVGINGQYTIFSKPNISVFEQSNEKSGSAGYGVTFGYEHALVPSFRLGAELGYEDLGKYKSHIDGKPLPAGDWYGYYSDLKIKQHMITLLVTTNYFITPQWNIIGKFGPAWVSQKADYGSLTNGSQTVPDKSYTSRKVAPYINLGTAYNFDNNMSVGVSYGHLFGSKIKTDADLQNSKKVLSSNAVQLNLGYTFPF